MYNLRDYQLTAESEIYKKISAGKKKIICWMGTGSGKGLMMSHFANEVIKKNKLVTTVMRRRDLIFQTKINYQKYHKINSSVIMGTTNGYDRKSLSQVCSIDTLRTRMLLDDYQYLRDARLIIIDECQDSNAPTYQRLFEWVEKHNPDAIFLGFTATPYTVGGHPLAFWEDYVQPMTPVQMVEKGFLMPDRHYAPLARIDTTGLKIEAGDFKEKDLFDRAKDSVIIGDIVSTWIKYGENRPTILFAVNKDHSMLMCAAFNQRGIPAIHVDEKSTASEREVAVNGLKPSVGKYKIMCNIETMTTGVDAPWVSLISWARPTWSEVLYCQGNGRAGRPYKICADCKMEYGGEQKCIRCGSAHKSFEKTDFIILDHAANAERHGFTYDDRQPKIKKLMGLEELKRYTGKSARKVENPVTICEKDFVYVKPGQPCPICGDVKKSIELPKNESGELQLIDDETIKKLRLNQLLSQYEFLKRKGDNEGWGPGRVYFAMYKKAGDMMLQFENELGIPKWVMDKIWEQKQKEHYEKENA